MIDFNKTLFVVEGPTEIESFRQKFQKEYRLSPVFRKAPSNGRDVSPEGYVNAIYGIMITALAGQFINIFCILDREHRKISSTKLAESIKNLLVLKFSNLYSREELENKIKVIAPDISFENWIISDVEGIKQKSDYIKEDATQKNFEGKSGVYALGKMMKVPYNKVLHAPLLFKQVCFSRAVVNSQSFEIFYREIS